jgi:hypothetical protein
MFLQSGPTQGQLRPWGSLQHIILAVNSATASVSACEVSNAGS